MNRPKQYVALLAETDDGKMKVKLAKRLDRVNQHVAHYKRVNARGFARKMNNVEFVIN